MALSLYSVEKSVKILMAALTLKGFTCTLEKFIDDTKGGGLGGSYIELAVERDDKCEVFMYYPVYGRTSKNDFSGQDIKWSGMKAKTLAVIEETFPAAA